MKRGTLLVGCGLLCPKVWGQPDDLQTTEGAGHPPGMALSTSPQGCVPSCPVGTQEHGPHGDPAQHVLCPSLATSRNLPFPPLCPEDMFLSHSIVSKAEQHARCFMLKAPFFSFPLPSNPCRSLSQGGENPVCSGEDRLM